MGLYQNRIVVKAGTSTLMNELGKSDLRTIELLCRVLADIHNKGFEIILVSSGAIAFGSGKLGFRKKPESIREKQAAAAVGQCSMLYLYDRFFGDYDVTIAQILLSGDDLGQPGRRENLLNTFDTLLSLGVIPIVNENVLTDVREHHVVAKAFVQMINGNHYCAASSLPCPSPIRSAAPSPDR